MNNKLLNVHSEKVSKHQKKVIEQYDSAQGWQFYQTVQYLRQKKPRKRTPCQAVLSRRE